MPWDEGSRYGVLLCLAQETIVDYRLLYLSISKAQPPVQAAPLYFAERSVFFKRRVYLLCEGVKLSKVVFLTLDSLQVSMRDRVSVLVFFSFSSKSWGP
jgi:hypothetical protein